MDGEVIYGVRWESEADRTRLGFSPARQAQLYEGLRIVARDPYAAPSRPVKGDERTRSVLITKSLYVEYVISAAELVVLVIHIIDGDDVVTLLD